VGQYVSDNSFEFVEGKGNEFARYFKVYSSVSEHEAFQFVMADQCAIMAYLFFSDYSQIGSTSFDSNGMTQFVPMDGSNVYIYKGIPREAMISKLEESLLLP